MSLSFLLYTVNMQAIILDFYGVIFNPTTRLPMEGFLEFLKFTKQNNLSCAVASSTDSNSIQQFLNEHHLAEYITTVIGADKVTTLKPDPECYSTAAAELNCVPTDCVVIDDTLAPLENAKKVGFQTIYFQGKNGNFTTITELVSTVLPK